MDDSISFANVVFPGPGVRNSNVWSKDSLRCFAAEIEIFKFSTILF